MEKYGEYILETRPLPAQKKNQLVFLKEVHWTSEDGRTKTTTDEVLKIEVAPLQEELVRKALGLFKSENTKKAKKGPIGSVNNPASSYPDWLLCPLCKKEMYPSEKHDISPQVQFVYYRHNKGSKCEQSLIFHVSKNFILNSKEAKQKAAEELIKEQAKQ